MEVLSRDFILGDFRASDYGLMLGSFEHSSESEDNLGITSSTIEEFVGQNPVPIYLGQKYKNKLQPIITLIKNPCENKDNLNFSEKELRTILRVITGYRGYKWLKVVNYEIDDDLWYRARVSDVDYKRVGGHVVGVVLKMECDSAYAWSKEYDANIVAIAGKVFRLYNNTDDLNNYVLPCVEIKPLVDGIVKITNITENRVTEIENVKANEKITIDSQRETIESDIEHNLLLNDFNLNWIRLVPDKNEFVSDTDININFKFRVPRKVGITE